mmetsp:Transcript_139108/g.277366  ORF Transcript_139108/g.277366 Transcript_139108/m.277366 type:complete len:267 (+) Transcript_139108:518-1318(+)
MTCSMSHTRPSLSVRGAGGSLSSVTRAGGSLSSMSGAGDSLPSEKGDDALFLSSESTLMSLGGGPAVSRSGPLRNGRFPAEDTMISVGSSLGGLKGMDFTAVGLPLEGSLVGGFSSEAVSPSGCSADRSEIFPSLSNHLSLPTPTPPSSLSLSPSSSTEALTRIVADSFPGTGEVRGGTSLPGSVMVRDGISFPGKFTCRGGDFSLSLVAGWGGSLVTGLRVSSGALFHPKSSSLRQGLAELRTGAGVESPALSESAVGDDAKEDG